MDTYHLFHYKKIIEKLLPEKNDQVLFTEKILGRALI